MLVKFICYLHYLANTEPHAELHSSDITIVPRGGQHVFFFINYYFDFITIDILETTKATSFIRKLLWSLVSLT